MKTIILKKNKEIPSLRKHPWIFSGAIFSRDESIEDGEIVSVRTQSGKFIGIGHFQNSSLAVRIFSFDEVNIDSDFWLKKLRAAYRLRVEMGLMTDYNNCFRLVFGESDYFPGLILDYYNGHVVFQAHSIGMHKLRNVITEALLEIKELGIKTIFDKSKESLPGNYARETNHLFLSGNGENTVVIENGRKFHVDWLSGQKTGFFLDQRVNRQLVADYSKGKKVLNTFCYTGGFSVYAGTAGASKITSVDSSKKAIELTEKNILENKIDSHEAICEDVFEYLKRETLDYEIIILDPPAFAKHRDAKHKAVIGYKNLNYLALKKAKKGTVIFTFSCTQVVEKNLFFNTVYSSAIEAGREVRILHFLNQPSDHPINPHHPESEYLKGVVLKVIE